MRILLTTLSTAAAIAFAAPALADQSGRYQLEPSGDGFVRMDTETGAISFCTQKDGSLTCRLAEDGRTGAGEIDRMAKRIEALEKRVAELEQGGAKNSVMSEEEFDRTMGYMERFLRRFMGVVQSLQKEYGLGGIEEQPDRT